MILLDTNLLARITDSRHPHCAPSRNAIQQLRSQGEQLVIVPQNLFEFWAVATRSSGKPPSGQNGLGMTCSRASDWIRYFQRRFNLLPDQSNLVTHWVNLVKSHAIKGFKCHDARLVAAMQTYGVAKLLTFNGADFKQFSIVVIDPHTV